MIIQEKCEVISNTEIADKHFKMVFKAPKIVSNVKPGQFVTVKVNDTYEPLLRKPFGIYEIEETHFSIVYRVIGKGTELLSKVSVGEFLDVFGPLGNGVEIGNAKSTAIVAGGVGLAAVGVIADRLAGNFDLYFGVKNKTEIFDNKKWQGLASDFYLSSDDGSVGEKGFITSVFEKKASEYERVFCCGPKVMMKKVYESLGEDTESYFLMEEYMACGIGICMGCVCETKKGYQRGCKEGPVFRGEDIKW